MSSEHQVAAALEDDIAIRVSGISKAFQVYRKPQDRLRQSVFPRLQRATGGAVKRYFDEYWALRDITFDVRRGDAVGIVGRNGSGKSTLLQIICGTLGATAGSVQVNGRVAALLELGAGFNPEFTGRENVYMSASILGLTRQQTDDVYESIVAFADIGSDFIDMPVKVYSSGMYVRLAFAVIAHVDADILIIDEALAVGDGVFVQKCMRFLRAFRERGTLLFVSHDTGSVINFCKSAVWLDRGMMRKHDSAQSVCNAYLEFCAQEVYGDLVRINSIRDDAPNEPPPALDDDVKFALFDNIANSDGWRSQHAAIESVELTSIDGVPVRVVAGGERVLLRIKAVAKQALSSPIIGFFVKDKLGQSLFGEHTFTYTQPPLQVEAGRELEAEFAFRLPLLPDGDYSMTVSIAEGDPWTNVQHHWLHDAVLIKVASTKLRYGLVGIPYERVSLQQRDRT